MEHLDLNTFGKMVDEALEGMDVKLLVEMPEGTQDATVTSNVQAGVLEFYVMLAAIVPLWQKMMGEVGGEEALRSKEELVDSILAMVKAELMEA